MGTPLSTAVTVIRQLDTERTTKPDYANRDVVLRALALGPQRDRNSGERPVVGVLPQAEANPIGTVFEPAANHRVQALNPGRIHR